MQLPTADEILGTLPEDHGKTRDEVQRALDLAPDVLETMTGTPIRRRLVQQDVFLRDRPEPLLTFPAEDVRAKGHPIDHISNTGVVLPEMEPSNYLVTFAVGYDRAKMPAIVVKAVTHMTRHHLLGDEEDREEAKAAIEIMRQGREKLMKERERDLERRAR